MMSFSLLLSTKHCEFLVTSVNKTLEKEKVNMLLLKEYGTVYLLMLGLALISLGFEVERTARVDFQQRRQAAEKKDQMEDFKTNNGILLRNLLPGHVAEHFMGCGKIGLYHEDHYNVGVMFASIPNFFAEFYAENDVNNNGIECMRVLNEIIADFDELLEKPKFNCIEKIKTIGATYLVAAGLTPKVVYDGSETDVDTYLCTLCEFAFAMQDCIKRINKHSFNNFQLRMGINHGSLVAGVIGATKPQYDIWGNTVNVASRMESTGKIGKIQITEDSSHKLDRYGFRMLMNIALRRGGPAASRAIMARALSEDGGAIVDDKKGAFAKREKSLEEQYIKRKEAEEMAAFRAELARLKAEVDDKMTDEAEASGYLDIEKIKTIGATYMVAAGLTPKVVYDGSETDVDTYLCTLCEFAFAMQDCIKRINKHSFNNFQLRMGINHGSLVAGVIGATKPQYDIWGNTVNVASRMESTGKIGKIQITEDSSHKLDRYGFRFDEPHFVQVKGKGNMKARFLIDRSAVLLDMRCRSLARAFSTPPRACSIRQLMLMNIALRRGGPAASRAMVRALSEDGGAIVDDKKGAFAKREKSLEEQYIKRKEAEEMAAFRAELARLKAEVDKDFETTIKKSDWVGLFEDGWQYLFSYLTFVWVTKVEKQEDGRLIMTVVFKKEHLPLREKPGGHQFCYVSRSGDVLGRSSLFVFQNPGLSFSDMDTCLVDESDVSHSITPAFDILTLDANKSTGGTTNSSMTTSILTRENDLLQRNNAEQESDLVLLRDSLLERDEKIAGLVAQLKDAQMQIAAKDKQMQSVEQEQFEQNTKLENENRDLSIQLSTSKNSEEELRKALDDKFIELQKTNKLLSDSESIVKTMQNSLEQRSSSLQNSVQNESMAKCQDLERQKASILGNLERRTEQVSKLERAMQHTRQELEQLKILLRGKDETISQMIMSGQADKAAIVTLKAAQSQLVDENKRLKTELGQASNEIKNNCVRVSGSVVGSNPRKAG
eukprot:sb/3461606/